jgi:hypothetical protein
MTLVLPFSGSNGWCHPPDSSIALQCQLWCPTLVFDISNVVDAVSDRLTNTADPFCLTLKAPNVVVNIRALAILGNFYRIDILVLDRLFNPKSCLS